jgi:anti-sigma factor RsiW
MKCAQIESLLPDYLTGDLGADESKTIEAHLETCSQCREEIALWKKLSMLPEEQPSPDLRRRFIAMLDAYAEGHRERSRPVPGTRSRLSGFVNTGWLRMPAAGLAWAIVLLAVGFIVGRLFVPERPTSDPQLAKLQAELAGMRQLVVLSLLQQQSASERLQAIAQATAWNLAGQRPDPTVLSALMRTLRSDSSVDVRLAALDALGRYHNQPEVRKGLLDALQTRQSPLVQVALIDLMVEMKDSSVVEQLKKFERDPSVHPAVREHAQWGIRKLT